MTPREGPTHAVINARAIAHREGDATLNAFRPPDCLRWIRSVPFFNRHSGNLIASRLNDEGAVGDTIFHGPLTGPSSFLGDLRNPVRATGRRKAIPKANEWPFFSRRRGDRHISSSLRGQRLSSRRTWKLAYLGVVAPVTDLYEIRRVKPIECGRYRAHRRVWIDFKFDQRASEAYDGFLPVHQEGEEFLLESIQSDCYHQ